MPYSYLQEAMRIAPTWHWSDIGYRIQAYTPGYRYHVIIEPPERGGWSFSIFVMDDHKVIHEPAIASQQVAGTLQDTVALAHELWWRLAETEYLG